MSAKGTMPAVPSGPVMRRRRRSARAATRRAAEPEPDQYHATVFLVVIVTHGAHGAVLIARG